MDINLIHLSSKLIINKRQKLIQIYKKREKLKI